MTATLSEGDKATASSLKMGRIANFHPTWWNGGIFVKTVMIGYTGDIGALVDLHENIEKGLELVVLQ